ncbi:7932_t:CDS:2, partial [Racocetra fulgida]
QCEIEYKNGRPEFRILFGPSFKHVLKSDESASKVATEYDKLKADQYSQPSLNHHAKIVTTTIKETFIQSIKSNYHNQNFIKLKSFEYIINNQNYFINFEKDNPAQKKAKLLSIVNVMDSKMAKGILIKLINMNTIITEESSDMNEDSNNIDEEFDNLDNEPNNLDSDTINNIMNSMDIVEKYESLKFILSPFLNDFKDLKLNGLE